MTEKISYTNSENQSNRAEKKHILMSLFHTLVVQKFQLSMPEF